MRRQSAIQKARHLKWLRALGRRIRRRRSKGAFFGGISLRRPDDALEAFRIATAKLPVPKIDVRPFAWPGMPKHKATFIYAPKTLWLNAAHDEVLGFMYQYRLLSYRSDLLIAKRRQSMVADLTGVESLGLDAALMLTAEYHRNCLKFPNRRPYISDETWPPPIRSVFRSLGLYDLVDAPPPNNEEEIEEPFDLRFVPFISGEKVEGEVADQLIRQLSEVAGSTPARVKVYAGLLEAIKNVRNHAYPVDAPPRIDPIVNRWWGAGAYQPSKRQLQFAVYDQGVGIPATLPKKTFFEAILQMTKPERTDADVIEGAIEYGRTQTDLEERGNGLWTICDVVRELKGSSVRIVSGRGQVTWSAGRGVRKKNFVNPFCGTLIEWTLRLPPEDEGRAIA
ncbi:hypothetical protein [Caulobacter sp. Root487D2Y]|uniref:hypothetical protein n=1 Tax=Caulobacter sp. Root487D2Y TaxID=1736547 RepID=UPI000B0CFF71|nr:hypothetical protein [Caulobacter sp. Root487D2Y]